MSYQAKVFNVMIASPSDVAVLRAIVREEVYDWNAIHSAARDIVLLPVGWETHSSPNLNGQRAQDHLNDKVLSKCDLLVGIFGTRLGTSTGKHESGTVEEIKEHVAAGKLAMVYFSTDLGDVSKFDLDQFQRLQAFRHWCQTCGLYEVYDSELVFRKKFSRQLQIALNTEHAFIGDREDIKLSIAEPEIDRDSNAIASLPREHAGATDTVSGTVGKLSEYAKELLKEGSQDPSGDILVVSYLSGDDIQTNNHAMNSSQNARELANWEQGLKQLVAAGLVTATVSKSDLQIYRLTADGYTVADVIPALPRK